MDGMRLRLEVENLHLKVGNVTHDGKSYVLLRAYDDTNNDIVLELTHEQAGWLEDQFYNANRRYEEHLSSSHGLKINAEANTFVYSNPPDQFQGSQYHRNQANSQQFGGNYTY